MEPARSTVDWDQLVERYHKPIFVYCFHMLRQRQDAEDAAQEIFLKAMKHCMQSGEDIRAESAWLYRIAHNHCINILKRRKLLSFLPFGEEGKREPSREAAYSRVDESMAIDALLAKLSVEDRSVMVLRIIEDKTFEEIGAILHASPATARKRFERAKRKAKKWIQLENEKGDQEHDKQSISFI